MSTIDEIKQYCQEKNIVGALLVTGRWGCGKTYLIEHSLSECKEIKSQYVIVRVSLFGESSPDSVRKKAKFAALTCDAMKESNIGDAQAQRQKFASKAASFTRFATTILGMGEAANSVFALDWVDVFDFPKTIDEKPVVLVFDDFERTTMNIQDLLGCINEFVETLRIKTIIIANEEAIYRKAVYATDEVFNDLSEADVPANEVDQIEVPKITYAEIKEKVISRTVRHSPNYEEIVEQIVSEYNGTEKYKEFLKGCLSIIQRVFRESKSDNIRSLVSGLQNFERIYNCLTYYDEKIYQQLFSTFLALVFESKCNHLNRGKYGYLFAYTKAKEKYSDFYTNYAIEATVEWIATGSWNQEEINSQLEVFFKRFNSITPEDEIFRSVTIVEVDDSQFIKGFPVIVQKAYDGSLVLDEYLILLRICLDCHELNISLPTAIDYELLKKSLYEHINNIILGRIDEPKGLIYLSPERCKCIDAISQICDMILKYREYEIEYRNRNAFIKAYREHNEKAIWENDSSDFKSFNAEMADIVSGYYCSLNNSNKIEYSRHILRVVQNNAHKNLADKNESVLGLEALIKSVSANSNITTDLSCAVDRFFIQKINETKENKLRVTEF